MRTVFLELIQVGVNLKIGRRKVSKLVVLLLSISLITIGWNTSVVSNGSSITKSLLLNDLTPIAKIIITSDEDFGPSGYNFPGDGTSVNPYLIENYNVSSTGPYGILIDANERLLPFNVSFVIQNCVVRAQEVCIKIVNTFPNLVTIKNCICMGTTSGDGIGIHLERCDGAVLIGNTCNLNDIEGIRVDASDSILIENNTCEDNPYGIILDKASNHNIMRNNNFTSNYQGIYLKDSSANLIQYNVVKDNEIFGCGLSHAPLNVFENNSISFNGVMVDGHGISVSESDSVEIKFNNFQENAGSAIYIGPSSDYLLLHHNNFIQNGIFYSPNQCSEMSDAEHIDAKWYDYKTLEGNYWDDFSGTIPHPIGGTAANGDPFPLNSMVIIDTSAITELHFNLTYFILALSLFGIATIMVRKRIDSL